MRVNAYYRYHGMGCLYMFQAWEECAVHQAVTTPTPLPVYLQIAVPCAFACHLPLHTYTFTYQTLPARAPDGDDQCIVPLQ